MGLIPQDWCPYERRSGHRHTGTTVWGCREETAVCMSRSEASETSPGTPRPWTSSLWTWDRKYLGVCFRGPNGLTVLGPPHLLHCLVQRHLPVTTLHPITPLYSLQSKPLFLCSPPSPRPLTSGSCGGGHLVPSGQYGLQPLEGVSCEMCPQETAADAGGFSTGSARLLPVETSFRTKVLWPSGKAGEVPGLL